MDDQRARDMTGLNIAHATGGGALGSQRCRPCRLLQGGGII